MQLVRLRDMCSGSIARWPDEVRGARNEALLAQFGRDGETP